MTLSLLNNPVLGEPGLQERIRDTVPLIYSSLGELGLQERTGNSSLCGHHATRTQNLVKRTKKIHIGCSFLLVAYF